MQFFRAELDNMMCIPVSLPLFTGYSNNYTHFKLKSVHSDKDAHRKEKITVFADKSLGGSEATECSTDYNEDAEYQSFSVKQSSVDSNQPDLRVLDRILSKAGDDFCDDEKDDGNVDDIDLDTFRKKCLEDPESLESMVCAAGNDDEEDEDTIVVIMCCKLGR